LKEIQTPAHALKVASVDYPVHELICARWSARAFSDQQIEEEVIKTCVEAARWAPSSMNEQPWKYLVTQKHKEGDYQKIWECLNQGNKPWTQKAQVLIVVLAEKNIKSTGMQNAYALHDVGAANMNLLLQATSMGLLGHMMGGFHAENLIQALGIPDHLMPVLIMALGYPDKPDVLEEPFYTREITPRTRKPLENSLIWDSWV